MDEMVRTDLDEKIEELIVKSVRLGEITARKRREGFPEEELPEIEKMEEVSEQLWQEAKRLGKPYVTKQNYEDLANAFLEECIEDYEDLISGASEGPKKNVELITDVLENQTFVKLDMTEQLDQVRHTYLKKFVPYTKKYRNDIVKQWEEFDKKRYDISERVLKTKHKCPLCGGCLKPRWDRKGNNFVIGCTGCKLWC